MEDSKSDKFFLVSPYLESDVTTKCICFGVCIFLMTSFFTPEDFNKSSKFLCSLSMFIYVSIISKQLFNNSVTTLLEIYITLFS